MEVKNKALNIDLSIEVVNDNVIAVVIFSNNLSNIVYLDGWTIGIHEILNRSVFHVTDVNDNVVPYYGMMASRIVTPEDFISLNPKERIQTKITVNKDYNLVKGQKYIIRYSAYNPACPGKQPNLELRSNKVEITY
jgi:hypothetical protein